MASAKLKDLPTDTALYDEDFYAWTLGQAAELRARRPAGLDWENLAEEIDDLGKSVFKELRAALRVIVTHMLKWDHQPERRSRSWVNSINTQRNDLEDVLSENPSLRRRQNEALAKAYRNARLDAATEMGRSERTLPETCPYSVDEILTREFPWPEA